MKIRLVRYLSVLLLMILILFVFCIAVPFIRFKFADSKRPSPRHVEIIAHRGACSEAPENTLASFRKALSMGVDMIELDVHLSADDSLMVMHDYDVSRTTDGSGEISSLTYKGIKKLDAGSWFGPAFKEERVPTLGEVLSLVAGKCKVLVELKWPSNDNYFGLVEKVKDLIMRSHAQSWVVMHTFEESYLKEAKAVAPKVERQQLLFGEAWILPVFVTRKPHLGYFNPEAGISSLNVCYFYLTPSFIRQCHERHCTVYSFMADSRDDMARVINMGVDGIITNHPEIAANLME